MLSKLSSSTQCRMCPKDVTQLVDQVSYFTTTHIISRKTKRLIKRILSRQKRRRTCGRCIQCESSTLLTSIKLNLKKNPNMNLESLRLPLDVRLWLGLREEDNGPWPWPIDKKAWNMSLVRSFRFKDRSAEQIQTEEGYLGDVDLRMCCTV